LGGSQLRPAQAKISETSISTNKIWHGSVGLVSPPVTGVVKRRIMVQTGPGINERPYLKNN
jgi:hypothetical protein